MMEPLRMALTKGRLETKTIELFDKMGLDTSKLKSKGRRLVLPLGDSGIEIALAKAPDVITYVVHGACDMGIVGKDTIMEYPGSHYEMLDLGFGKCRFVLAAKEGTQFFEGYHHKIIATKYPNVARSFFQKKGVDVEIVKIEGSVELAPILGLCDAIVDITETGRTLRENGLVVIENICDVSARLIVNVASMKLRKAQINEFISDMALALEV